MMGKFAVRLLLFGLGLQAFLACSRVQSIAATNPGISVTRSVYYFRGLPFTGEIVTTIPSGHITRKTPYLNGREHGRETTVHDNGQLLEERFYDTGLKVGLHSGWYTDGTFRFHGRFVKGNHVGDFWGWHRNGVPHVFERYTESGQQVAAKKWRPSGQIYYNYVRVNGNHVGLGGSYLCDPANKSGEYINDANVRTF